MSPRFGMIALLILTFGLATTDSVFSADPKAILIKGKVIGDNGKPCEGAEIRVLRVDAKAREVITLTDARGQYFLYGLPPGAYTVTAYYNGFARSRASIKTLGAGWAKVDFDLGLDKGAGDGVDRMQRDLYTTNKGILGNPH